MPTESVGETTAHCHVARTCALLGTLRFTARGQHNLNFLFCTTAAIPTMLRVFSRLLSEGRRGLPPLASQTSEAFRAPAVAAVGTSDIRSYAAVPDPVSEEDAGPVSNQLQDGAAVCCAAAGLPKAATSPLAAS